MKTYYIFIQGELFYGWTDSEYIATQYINIDKYLQFRVVTFDGTYDEFCKYLLDELNMMHITSSKIHLITNHDNSLVTYNVISSEENVDVVLYESGMFDRASNDLIFSMYKLKLMSKYINDKRMVFLIEYIFRRYILDLIDYVRGVDDRSDRFDPIYVLQKEKYLGVITIEDNKRNDYHFN